MSGQPRGITVVTGSRAEFGLLEPVMRAIQRAPGLELRVIVAGSHLLGPAETWRDVKAAGFEFAAVVEMQRLGERGRIADAVAVGRGVEAFARAYERLTPGWVVVLGDRVEAFAAASAASIGGLALAQVHGGDRAEGIADEAMRHAITKLSHLHLAATPASAERIVRMGELPERVHVTGSSAIDGLGRVAPMSDTEAADLGNPEAVFMMHPSGLDEDEERSLARAALHAAAAAYRRDRVLCMAPNHDPGREIIISEVREVAGRLGWMFAEHLPRARFIALLKRLAAHPRALIIGNSSAALIEAAALRLPAVNIGPRQAGRERADNVIDTQTGDGVHDAIQRAWAIDRAAVRHPYGDGKAGARIAGLLLATDPSAPVIRRKRCTY